MAKNPNDWTIIVDEIIRGVEKGKFQKGEKLPSENKLADRYGVPRADVRRAYGRLKELGDIYSLQGSGSFFAGRREKIPLSMISGGSFTQKMKELGVPYESKNIQAKRIGYNEPIFECLKAEKGDAVWKIVLLRILNGEPAALHTRYLPEKYFPHLSRDAAAITSSFAYLKQNGYEDFYSADSQFTLGLLSKRERQLLGLTGYATALTLSSKTIHRPDGAVLELYHTVYRADRFIFLL